MKKFNNKNSQVKFNNARKFNNNKRGFSRDKRFNNWKSNNKKFNNNWRLNNNKTKRFNNWRFNRNRRFKNFLLNKGIDSGRLLLLKEFKKRADRNIRIFRRRYKNTFAPYKKILELKKFLWRFDKKSHRVRAARRQKAKIVIRRKKREQWEKVGKYKKITRRKFFARGKYWPHRLYKRPINVFSKRAAIWSFVRVRRSIIGVTFGKWWDRREWKSTAFNSTRWWCKKVLNKLRRKRRWLDKESYGSLICILKGYFDRDTSFYYRHNYQFFLTRLLYRLFSRFNKRKLLLLKTSYFRLVDKRKKNYEKSSDIYRLAIIDHKNYMNKKKLKRAQKIIIKTILHRSHKFINRIILKNNLKQPNLALWDYSNVQRNSNEFIKLNSSKKYYSAWDKLTVKNLIKKINTNKIKHPIARLEDLESLSTHPRHKALTDTNVKYNQLADTIYNSYWAGHFLNIFIREGKKKTIFKVFLKFYSKLKYQFSQIPLIILLETLEKLKPPFKLNGFVVRRTQELRQFPAMATNPQKYSVVIKWLKKEVKKEEFQSSYMHKKSKRVRPKRVIRSKIINNIYNKFYTFKIAPKRHALTKLRSILLTVCREKFFMFRQKRIKRRAYRKTFKF